MLAVILLDVASGIHTPVEAGVEAGRRVASAVSPGADPLDVLEAEMARRGFAPRREGRATTTELVLERCPFEVAAAANPGIVCEIHRGLAQGILDGMHADVRVSRLVAYPPERAGCRIEIVRSTAPDDRDPEE
jgi:predicted ArsR family transcriptional regulator